MTGSISPFNVLADDTDPRGPALSPSAAALYGAPSLDLPAGISCNMIATIDGAAALPGAVTSGGEFANHDPHDRFLMALLRDACDALVIGASTYRAFPGSFRRDLEPSLATRLDALPVVVVTGSGNIPAGEREEILCLAPQEAIPSLIANGWNESRIRVLGQGGIGVRFHELAGEFGGQRLLCEGGPNLLGTLFSEGCVRDFFLTRAPLLVGRVRENPPLPLIEGSSFALDAAPRGRILSLRRAQELLFLRYRFDGVTTG